MLARVPLMDAGAFNARATSLFPQLAELFVENRGLTLFILCIWYIVSSECMVYPMQRMNRVRLPCLSVVIYISRAYRNQC